MRSWRYQCTCASDLHKNVAKCIASQRMWCISTSVQKSHSQLDSADKSMALAQVWDCGTSVVPLWCASWTPCMLHITFVTSFTLAAYWPWIFTARNCEQAGRIMDVNRCLGSRKSRIAQESVMLIHVDASVWNLNALKHRCLWRIFCAEQITVPPALPDILKATWHEWERDNFIEWAQNVNIVNSILCQILSVDAAAMLHSSMHCSVAILHPAASCRTSPRLWSERTPQQVRLILLGS